jgi:hypothetical protein
MSLIGLGMNVLLAVLLACALALGLRLNRRLKALRDSHDGFAVAVRELNAAAERAEQGLADLRAATDEATDTLADRIEKGRALAARLERLIAEAPAGREAPPARDEGHDKRLGALLAAARDARARPERPERPERPSREERPLNLKVRSNPEDDLFEDPPLRLPRGNR